MESHSSGDVRARLGSDVAAGKTVVLSARDLDDPAVRAQLPALLEELARAGAAPPPGLSVPGYALLGEIGQGGMSTVYLARQETLGRHVALKVAPKWLGGGERATRRLMQEARAMARVTHPNIVVIHDILDVGDTFAIAMEWIDGCTLATLLRALPPEPGEDDVRLLRHALGASDVDTERFEDSPVRHFVRLVRDVARATQAVHDAGLLHLDIKPSNVLVRRDGTPLLADFGVVREMAPEPAHTRTFAGTPVYSAPEQLRRDDRRIGPPTDVYGLGMTLYESLARRQPLHGLDLPGILQCVESGRMPRLSSETAVTPDLENVVHKAIAPEPEHRYASAGAFADDLDAFLEHRPVAARPLTRAQRLRRWTRNEPWKAALATALLVLVPALLGLGTYLLLQLPQLARIEREAQLERANRLKQDAFQRWFTDDTSGELCVDLLEQAMALDPGDSSLACLVAMTNEDGWQHAARLLEAHDDAVRRVLGLRLCAARAAAGRSFFDATEVDRLRRSPAPIDAYVLALDRVFWAEDAGYEEAYREAQRCLEEALLMVEPDPLLFALQAWTSARCEDPRRFDAVCRALRRHWPTDVVVLAWQAISIEQLRPDEAKRISEELIALAPSHPRGHELLVGAALRSGDLAAVDRHAARARAAGVRSPIIDWFVLNAGFKRDAPAAPADLLAAAAAYDASVSRRIELTHRADPTAASALVEQLLAAEEPAPRALSRVFTHAQELGDDALAERSWQRYRALYPDRRQLHYQRMHDLFRRRDLEGAAALVAETMPPVRAVASMAPFETRFLLAVRDWAGLERAAERWLEFGDVGQRQEAAFYAGLAASRLGAHDRAAERLAQALRGAVDGKSWFAQALLEDAWLRVAPSAPAALRDPELAALRLRAFEARNRELRRPHAGPWTDAVRAEVRFANGDRDGAIAAAERALAPQRREPHAPADYRAILEAALTRYGR